MSLQNFRDLFDHLDQSLFQGCDHTLKATNSFVVYRGLDLDRIVSWLQENGGYCDCEVLANVEDVVRDCLKEER